MRRMNPFALTSSSIVARLLAVLVALFGASAQCVRRVAAMRGRVREGFAHFVTQQLRRGRAIAYAGEDEATVDARIARMEWIARDPVKALRHECRRMRGWLRARLCADMTPVSFAPPVVACAVLAAGAGGFAVEPDT